MKRTKILATIGPKSNSKTTIAKMVSKGADAFRINISHGNQDQWKDIASKARSVAPHLPLIVDTRGPELRLLNVEERIKLHSHEEFTFALRKNNDIPYLSHPTKVKKGQIVIFDDGAITATVSKVGKDRLTVNIHNEGYLSDKRKVALPLCAIDMPILSKEDRADIPFLKKLKIDGVAASFTRTARDVRIVRGAFGDDCFVIAKIEDYQGIDNIEEIIAEADAVLIGRGDLGVEIALEEVPVVQKQIVRACNYVAKPVIVATQMLESMVHNNRPTRAEASDVANAILDGADCLMLSAETAMGHFPVEAVGTMSKIALKVEQTLPTRFAPNDLENLSIPEAISNSVVNLAAALDIDVIVTATSSGLTARRVSRLRPKARLVGVAHSERVMRRLQFTWGVTPCTFHGDSGEPHKTVFEAVVSAVKAKLLKKSDWIIATAGVDTMQVGSTNLIEVHHVGDFIQYHKKHSK